MERKHFFAAAVLMLTFAISGCTEVTPPEFNSPFDPLSPSYPVPAPKVFQAAMRTSTEVVLGWAPTWAYEKGYIVERSVNGGAFEKIANLPAFSDEYVDTGLDTTKSYSYRVKRFTDLAESKYSSLANLKAPLPGSLKMKPLSYTTKTVGAVSHNKSLVATVSDTKTNQIIFWNVPQYTVDGFFDFQGKTVKAVSFSADDKLLACASADDYSIYIYDVKTKIPVNTIKGITGGITSIGFSPDGKFLAVALLSRNILVYNTSSWTLSYTLSGHSSNVNALCFSPDGSLMASGSADGMVILWNTSDWTAVRTFSTGESNVKHLTFSPDGQIIAAAAGMNYCQFETSTGNKLRSLPSGGSSALSVAFSNDGKRFAGTCGTGFSIFDSNYKPVPLDFSGISNSTFSYKVIMAAPGGGIFITLGYPFALWGPGSWTITYQY